MDTAPDVNPSPSSLMFHCGYFHVIESMSVFANFVSVFFFGLSFMSSVSIIGYPIKRKQVQKLSRENK